MHAVIEDGKKRMDGALASLVKEFSRLRTGRASVSLIEPIMADYYGTPTPISQIASLSVPDARTITIQPWDKQAFGAVEKAILKSDLGLNPVNDGKMIRISMPPLTEDRRKDLVKVAKKFTEEAKVAVATNCSTTRDAPWRRQTRAQSHHSLGLLKVRHTMPLIPWVRTSTAACSRHLQP